MSGIVVNKIQIIEETLKKQNTLFLEINDKIKNLSERLDSIEKIILEKSNKSVETNKNISE